VSASVVDELEQETPAQRLNVGHTAALLFVARTLQYLSFGITGVFLARGLGPDGRGIYGLVNETAASASSFPGMGLEMAGIYLAGQRRYPWQTVFSNSFTWAVTLWLCFAGLIVAALVAKKDILGMSADELAIAFAGACLIMLTDGACEYLLPMGRVWPYTFIKLTTPIIRLVGVVVVALAIGLSIGSAVGIWLASFAVGAALTLYFLRQHVTIVPRINAQALKAQASFGSRGQAGFILQALNHRLDAFLVAFYIGAGGVGQYLVGVNLAELSWWVPITLGTVLFPKVSAMEPRANFEFSAATCRRTLAITLFAMAGLVIVAPPGMPIVYGSDFGPAVPVFLILLPSGLLYTVHKVLGSSLSANGMPQATLISGTCALPATIVLNLLLIPSIGIKGAAIASDVAYAINAAVVLALFVRVSGLSVHEALVFNREDWNASAQAVKNLWNNYILRQGAYQLGEGFDAEG
jgi:O-antigen/teichoic acid export membrane protein